MKHNIDNQILQKLNMTAKKLYNCSARHAAWLLLLLVIVVGSPTTSTAGVVIKGNVYGGGNLADVGQSVTVNVSGGEVEGDVYGGGAKANTNKDNWNDATSTFTQTFHAVSIKAGESVEGYFTDAAGTTPATGTAAADGTYYKKTETIVNLTGGEVKQDVYGGGLGYDDAEDDTKDVAANVYGNVTVITTGGKARDVFGANNVKGTPSGIIVVNINGTDEDGVRNVYGGGNQATYEGSSTTVTMTAGKAVNVYGGGLSADVAGSVTVNIQGGTVTTDVYGGGALGHTNTGNWNGAALASTYATIVNLTDGTIGRDVYGGGLGRKAVAASGTPETEGYQPAVSAVEAKVYGNVTVNIGAAPVAPSTTPTGNVTISGSVFGCNNANGTPMGNVLVNVYKTAHTSGDNNNLYPPDITDFDLEDLDESSDARYAIKAVYGGGNLAHYTPVAPMGSNPAHSTTVHVYGCEENTVKAVYGGGNAADVGTADVEANTNVIIEGGRFYTVFGGGNGKSTELFNNPGANIKGTASTDIQGGLFYQIFGGSDSKGDVNVVQLSINPLCETMMINESFGGANMSPLTGDVITNLTCSENSNRITIGNFYGGSNQADITGNVTLNVYGGRYGNVFGGSKGVADDPDTQADESISADITGNVTLNLYGGTMTNAFGGSDVNGNITGKITVNVLDYQSTTCPLVVTNVYGAGNLTPYTPSLVNSQVISSPEVNVIHMKSGNSITGSVYGGGKGDDNHNALVTANPVVNIGYDATTMSSLIPTGYLTAAGLSSTDDLIATISGNVLGGGDLAQVAGSTTVNLRKANSSVAGSLFGGGNAASVGNATVNVIDGSVSDGVYGGCNTSGSVGGTINNNAYDGNIAVNVTGGTVGAEASRANVHGGGYGQATSTTGNVAVTVNGASAVIWGDVYGGSALGSVNNEAADATSVTLTNGTVHGNLYGGGLGYDDAEDNTKDVAAPVNGAVTVTVNGGTVVDVFGCNNVYGSPQNTVTVNINNNVGGNVYGGGNLAAYTGSPAVNVNHGTVTHSVYGGGKGNTAVVTGSPIVTIGDNNAEHYAVVTENVYGGGDAAAVTGNTTVTYNDNHASSTVANLFGGGNAAGVSGNTSVTLTSGTVSTAVYGGCNASGTVGGTSTVNVNGGQVGTSSVHGNVHGGGYGANTYISGNVEVNIGASTGSTPAYTGTATIYGDIYGGGALGHVNATENTTEPTYTANTTTTVNLNKGTIYGDAYGGGLGDNSSLGEGHTTHPAYVGGDVYVNLHEAVFNITTSTLKNDNNEDVVCATSGRIFGGNNINGTPKGHITVHVFNTVEFSGSTYGYDLAAVFGGGNEADYDPSAAGYAEVIIEGCDNTSIKDVYGGGNAAAVPATNVWILGSHIIQNVYGGGNGELGASHAAHVGFHRTSSTTKSNYANGSGETNVKLIGGNITNVYGGSNSNGDIRVKANVTMPKLSDYTNAHPGASTSGCCDKLVTQYVYGGGSQADLSGDVNVILECMPEDYVEAVYGGAQNADVNGSVELTVTSGKFGRVFGGNNTGGNINGSITVNVYEDGCKPLIIGELYGAGNNAPYSIYGLNADGTAKTSGTSDLEGTDAVSVNVLSCTSIGKVYGGGKGSTATVVGNTHVWINMLNGIVDGNPKNDIGKIGQVFGGGSAADVIGNTTIDVGTATVHQNPEINEYLGVNIVSDDYLNPTSDVMNNSVTAGIYGGGEAADVDGNTTLNIGTVSQNKGINITGDIFGGGLGSGTHVTGNVTVNIGKSVTTEEGTSYVGYATITGDVYGGSAKGKVNSKLVNSVETAQTGKTTQVNFYGGTITGTDKGNIYGGGLGDATYAADVYGPVTVNVYGGTANNVFGCNNVNGTPKSTVAVNINGGAISQSVYGGGNQAIMDGSPVVNVTAGTIGTANEGGAVYGNVYGGGLGSDGTGSLSDLNKVKAGLVKGNTEINISGGTILHNIYGGGAYGSVGTFVYEENDEDLLGVITGYTSGGKATITITGGIIGTNGDENGMVFGSSRGDVGAPDAIHDKLAWVYDTEVNIGTNTGTNESPNYVGSATIKGSVYGGGENGHNYHNAVVNIYRGTIGIASGSDITDNKGTPNDPLDDITYSGAEYPYRGNVYGGGCGTDKYDTDSDGKGDTYNPLAGIVQGNATVTMSGGTVIHHIYGAGAMGSVGATDNTGAIVSGGTTSITISGGTIGVDGDDNGNVFGAARGNSTTTQQKSVALVKTTGVTISGTADVKGSVYGGGEIGNVGTYTTSADGTNTYPDGSGVCAVTVSGGTVRGNVFGAGKGIADSFTSERAMVNSTSVTISNGTVTRNVYGGGEIGRVENNTVVAISAGEIIGNVFGGGQGVDTHGYSGLVRGNSMVTIEGNAKVRQNVYGGGETATVGKYWVKGVSEDSPSTAPADLPSGMPYKTRAGGQSSVTIQGNAQVGPDAGATETVGHVFGAGKGVEPQSYTYVDSDKPSRRNNLDAMVPLDSPADYLQFLETLALVSYANVTIGGNATVKGNVYGGSESGFVQDNTQVQVQGGTIEGNVYGGGKGLESFTEAGKVKGATNVTISGGTTNGDVYGGGQLGVVQQNVAVTVSGGQVVNDVYGGGALANTNTDNWNTQGSAVEYVEVTGLTVGTTSVAGYYTRSGAAEPYTYTLITESVKAAGGTTYYKKKVVGTWADTHPYNTTVDLIGGVVGNAYGGGLGDADHAANVYGDVTVTVNDPEKLATHLGITPAAAELLASTGGAGVAFTQLSSEPFTIGSSTTEHTVAVTGHVFGCNNINGTPTGDVFVHVFSTRQIDEEGTIVEGHIPAEGDTESEKYEIQGVYGGGNLSDYLPAEGKKTKVQIDGCGITSIKKVYGGGNSAMVPETDVLITGSYAIGYAFGGGNGGEYIKKNGEWQENEGAIVIGTAKIACHGGKVGSVFGASDAKGVCGGTNIDTNASQPGDANYCPLKITRIYGAGNEADVNGNVNTILSGCTSNEVEYVHGGSYNAHITGNVTLTITSGILQNVYGGNDARGSIGGSITVNIEETEHCDKPIIIQNLVGGGNNAPYPGTTRAGVDLAQDENWSGKITVNVKSATRIDNVYGGCFNAQANADTEVNINMLKGRMAGRSNISIPKRYYNSTKGEPTIPNITYTGADGTDNIKCSIKDEIGTIGNVYGGGNEGRVVGNTVVNIGTESEVNIMDRNADGQILDINGNVVEYVSGVNLDANPENQIVIRYVSRTVEGAHITGDVYGGGNLAVVTGNTYVNICANMQPVLDGESKPTGEYTYTPVAEGTAGVKVGGSVYGGGNAADVQSNTFVRMENGYVYNGIFGGGYSGSVGTITARSLVNYDGTTHTSHTGCVGGKPSAFAPNTGKCTVVVNGGQIGPVEVASEGMPNPHGWVWGGGCGLIEDPADDPDVDFKTYVNETDVTIGGTAFIMEGIIGGGEFGRVLGNTLVKIQDHCQIGVGAGMAADGKPVRYTDGYNYGSGVTTNQFVDPTEVTITSGEGGNALAECAHWPYGEDTNNDGVADKFDCLPYDPYFDKYSSPAEYAPASTAHPSDGKTWIGVVFGGGSGYMPYEKADGTGYDWIPSAGLVEGNTEVRITGGHVLTNVYGGNEITDVKGKSIVKMSGGTIGVPRTLEQIAAHPVTCYLFGAGKGDQRSHFNNMTNVGSVEVEVSGGIIYGSVFGGSEDGHVLGNVKVDIKPGAKIGTWGTSYVDGNVFGGGRGFSGDNLNAGSVGGTVTMNITGGTMLGSVYGGGRLGSVEDDITITISGGTIGNSHEYTYDASSMLTHTRGGNVFAGGMGRMYQLDGTTPISSVNWWELGNVKSTKLTISGGTIKSNVYGGGELGMVKGTHTSADSKTVSTEIIIEGGTIGTEIQDGGVTRYTFGSVFGGGYGSLVEQLNHTGSTNPTYATYAYTYPKYIAGRVKNSTEVTMTAGTVLASVYGGGEMAAVGESTVLANPGENDPVVLGETLTGEGGTPLEANTYVIISGGTIGKTKDIEHDISYGGAKMGNVYGGGSGHNNTVRSGQIYGNTNVTISGTPTIYHNVYGGGAYGTVGDFEYETGEDPETHTKKVFGVSGRSTDHSNSGVTNVTITGGTIGIDGHNNGMVFGSSRGDINQPDERDDHTAWVYDTHVTIGTANTGTSTPIIYGSVYGGGENGHTFNNTAVTIHSGTIGVVGDPTDPNRGNVYGSGCGTDKYYANHALETHDGEGQLYNPLAGIVYGNATITIDGGKVVHNVYGGGSMGSVGKAGTDAACTITSGGLATINVSGGQIGQNGTSNGNVFGAARGDVAITQDGFAQVKTTQVNINAGANVLGSVFGGGEAGRAQVDTHVNMSGGAVAQNVFGGGYLGNIGVIDKTDINNYKWANQVDDATQKTGICYVTVTGGTVGPANNEDPTIGNVFGAGKGSGATFQCENAMTYDANVTVSNGTVNGDVFGGGEVGRVENNTKVTIGAGTGEGPFTPHINGDVFGGGKGLVTHGYSALVRGNTEVSVQGNAQIAKNVFGGGEIASVGRYGLDAQKMPNILLDGGDCKVTVQGNAIIGPNPAGDQVGNVYGAGKGIDPQTFDKDNADKTQRSRRMTIYTNATSFPEDKKGTTWEYIRAYSQAELDDNTITKYVWQYYQTKDDYAAYLETLALTTAPDVTIDGSANVNGSVFGGGEMGLTKGSVTVTILGGTIKKDVYGGGALANTNTTDQIGVSDGNGGYQKDGNGEYITTTMHSVTDVYLQGGLVYGDAYGGGLGQIGENPIEAKTFGEINVYLGGDEDGASTSATAFNTSYLTDDNSKQVVNSGRVFGSNNRNGSPQENVTVTVWKTVTGKLNGEGTLTRTPSDKRTLKDGDVGYVAHTYEVAAVYGGGNLASFTAAGKKTHVIIHGCDDTSIETVYGGGNAAAVTEASVDVYSCYEIASVFGGGNGNDKYTLNNGGTWVTNPGANVNGNVTTWLYGGVIHEAYGGSNELGTITGSVFIDVSGENPDNCDLVIEQIAGAGKNADINGDLIVVMGCKPDAYIPLVYGGANNANVNGNVELTITSGNFGKVFGGNNLGGAIKGHVKLTIEETSCSPTIIEELYLGGMMAAYSIYGYYVKTTKSEGTPVGDPSEDPDLKDNKLIFIPRTSADDPHLPVDTYTYNEETKKWSWTVKPLSGEGAFTPYADPELNIISCTSIGKVFGGGLGEGADMYANPTVNINMIPGSYAGGPHKLGAVGGGYTDMQNVKHEGGVFGGGNEATVYGNTTVNIGTETEVYAVYPDIATGTDVTGKYTYNDGTYTLIETATAAAAGVYYYEKKSVEGANIVGNVYGGGNLADVGKTHLGTDNEGKTIDVIDVVGNTFVNICATNIQPILDANSQPTGTYTFTPVGVGTSGVTIGGNVFGGGKGEAAPSGDGAFRCGKAMVTGGTNVHIGNGTVGTLSEGTLVEGTGNVYGGGEVGRVEVNTMVTIGVEGADENTSNPTITGSVFGAGKGIATHGYSALVRGNSTVTIQGFAKVGECVYGGGEIASVGKYNINAAGLPESLANQGSGYCTVIVRDDAEIGPDDMTMTKEGGPDNSGHVFGAGKGATPGDYTSAKHMTINDEMVTGFDTESAYLTFIETLGLATQTEVTIAGNAFVKGDVFGGAEQGFVQHDTHVIIQDDCQIGNGYVQMDADGNYLARASRYSLNRRYTATEWADGRLYKDGETNYASSLPECASWEYASPYAPHDDFADKYESKGGALVATNGSTFYGNVFGGGSGYFSYAPGKWHWKAGDVGGNTIVEIKGGHVLTNVYGGNELTNVTGKCTVTMSGGTIGVPRTLGQIAAHPVTCYLFGGGKGDPRVLFNKQTNVNDVEVNITGGWIYGSAFGGGEDGHVMRNVTMKIGGTAKIGTWGTSYVDGNVFGGGRGFAGDAYTAGNVAGSVTMNISGGTMLGSIYGGGRLGSVGYGLYDAETDGNLTPGYGEMRDDTKYDDGTNGSTFFTKGRGHVEVTITGGTIGNSHEFIMPNKTNITAVNTALSKSLNTDFTKWSSDDWKTWKSYYNVPNTEYDTSNGRVLHTKGGNVYAGGMGRYVQLDGSTPISTYDASGNLTSDIEWKKLGNVKNTTLTISGTPWIMGNVYGGGEMGAVTPYTSGETVQGGTTSISIEGGTIGTEVTGTTPVKTTVPTTTERSAVQYTYGSVYGGGMGMENHDAQERHGGEVSGNTTVTMSGADTEVRASVFGGGEMAVVDGDTNVTIENGKIGRNEVKPLSDSADAGYVLFGGATMGNVYGGGKGHKDHTEAGLVKGNTNVSISGGNVYHMVYGGGALGSVGTFTVSTGTDDEAYVPAGIPLHWTEGTGTATVNITGGTIGISGRDNGLVFGSSRGGLMKPVDGLDPYDRVAWVNKSVVTIGTPGSGSTLSTPLIKGSVYGGGENGHNNVSATVNVYSGTIGITAGDPYYDFGGNETVTAKAKPYRGNVYGAGSGSDTYKGDDNQEHWNPKSGMIAGNTFVNISGGLVGRAVYGGGAMASIGTEDNSGGIIDGTGTTTVTISGGQIGVDGNDNGNVFGAARGNATSTQVGLALVKTTDVTISGTAAVKGSVYGGGEIGDVQGNTAVAMQGGTVAKNVFGGGKGDGGLFDCSKAMVGIEGDGAGKEPGSDENKAKGTSVTISNGTVNGNVYGGGEVGRVEWNTQVTVGAVSGSGTPKVEGSVFGAGKGLETHGYSALVRGNSTVTVQGTAQIGKNVYGGGEKATVGRYWVKNRNNRDPETKEVYEAARPEPEDLPDGMPYKQQSGGICTVTIKGNAEIGYNGAADGAGHVFGAGQGVVPHYSDGPKKKVDDGDLVVFEADNERHKTAEEMYNEFLETLALVTNTYVTINGEDVKVNGNVYGGSESGFVQHDTNVTIQDGTIGTSGSYGTVFGGGKGLSLTAGMTFEEAGKVKENTTVNILGGTMYGDVYGGGALGKSNTAVDNGNYPTATVNLKGGTITGSAYGGGLGNATTAANVGNTILHLNKDLETTVKGCIVKGYIFGANNVNGTPLGHALVHIHATQNEATSNLLTKVENYDVKGVFGGGNASDYVPASTDAKQSTEVIIEGCDLTSIQDVYGGGYGAATPATEVLIKGTYLIDNVFGGGYGAGDGNPGANVGIKTGGGSYGENVTGKANVKLMAGRIHHVYGASNTKGDISGGSSVTTVAKETPAGACKPICENLVVDDIYGGGQDAPMVGGTEVVLGCMPGDWVNEIYAGSENADVGNDVMLTITSGKFGRVFGGNKSGGKLDGGIVVNIEENPNCDTPIVIGELYGGGNEASYSAYGYKKVDGKWQLLRKGDEGANASASPVVVHAKAFTSIGKIFGGAKGSSDPEKEVTLLIGNPWVLVDEVAFDKTALGYKPNGYNPATDTGKPSWIGDGAGQVKLYPHENGEMGVVGTIFGGGNEAKVEGNTTVKIASYDYVVFWSAPELDDVTGFYTRSGEGTPASPYVYTEATGAPTPGAIYYKKVAGADIRGNVYGGGNNAEVTGDTNVVIGRKTE